MPIFINELPQTIQPVHDITLTDLIAALPMTLTYPVKVWVTGEMAKYGRTTNNLVFLADVEAEPSPEMKEYFNSLCEPLGINATVAHDWRDRKWLGKKGGLMPLYNEGRLIIDKETMAYTEVPHPTAEAPVITLDDLYEHLPQQVEWTDGIYLTGSLAWRGWSANDADMIVFPGEGQEPDKEKMAAMRIFFSDLLGWKTDVGHAVMPEREPVFLYKLYENGALCLS